MPSLLPIALAALLTAVTLNGGTERDIQSAIALSRSRAVEQPRSPNTGGTYSRQQQSVVLRGKFTLSKPIAFDRETRLHLDGAILNGAKLPPNAFAITGSGFRCQITGSGTITNCPNGIQFNTGSMKQNLGGGNTLIECIHFAGIRGTALDIQCRSSVVVVERCIFDRVSKFVHNRMCDEITLRNCTASPTGDQIPITTGYGRLVIDGGIYTPLNYAQTDPTLAWVEIVEEPDRWSNKMLLCRGVRFGGEFGGLPIVINRSKGRTSFPSAPGVCITLRDCHSHNVQGRADAKVGRPGALVLLEQIPNRVEIAGCYGMVSPGPAVAFVPGVDGAELVKSFSADGVNNRCRLEIQDFNTVRRDTLLAEPLRQFLKGE